MISQVFAVLAVLPALASAQLIVYSGGPVIEKVDITPVFVYGKKKVRYQSDLFDFYSALAPTTYLSKLSEFSTASQVIGAGKTSAPVIVRSGFKKAVITQKEIEAMLVDMVKKGTLKPSKNTLYPVHTAPGVSVKLGEGKFDACQGYCSFNSGVDISAVSGSSTKFLWYSVVPDQGGDCKLACGFSENIFENLSVVSSRSLIDAITNPAGSPSDNIGSAQTAWFSNPTFPRIRGGISGVCNYQVSNPERETITASNGVKYTVQKHYTSSNSECIV